MGISWEIDHKSLGDQPDFSRYQMVYIGPGKRGTWPKRQRIWLVKSRRCWMRWKAALCSWQLGTAAFCSGKALLMPEGSRYPVLGCLTIRAKRPATFLFLTYWLIRYSRQKPHLTVLSTEPPIFMAMTRDPLFTVVKGAGDGETAGESHEGNLYRNFFGTLAAWTSPGQEPRDFKRTSPPAGGEEYRDWNTTAEELALKLTLNEIQ